jgi:hypothetical protein
VKELRKMKGSDGGKLMGSTFKGCPLCNKRKELRSARSAGRSKPMIYEFVRRKYVHRR